MRNYYEILEVFPKATTAEVKDAFRFLLFRFHPDHNKGKEDWAVAKTMELVEAYHCLADEKRRAHYDLVRGLKLRDEPPPKKGFGLFGGKNTATEAGAVPFKAGLEQYRNDEVEQAITSFRRTLELDPEHPNCRYNLAICFLAIERLNDALTWLQDHATRNKDDQEARAVFARIAALNQKLKQAKA